MSYVQRLVKEVTTDGSGDATAYVDVDYGLLQTIRYVKASSGNYDNGVDFTITSEATGEVLWQESDVNASATRAPRQATHSTAGAAALYAGGGAAVNDKIAIAKDRIKIVVASGGSVKQGTFHFVLV